MNDKGSARERLARQADALRIEPAETGPLEWADIAFLAHGMAFASVPLHRATKGVTRRHDLGPRGTWMLNLIAIGLTHPHELADILRIGRSLTSIELARLTEAGLVIARQSKTDGRKSELALTDLGQAAFEELSAELSKLIAGALAQYTPQELRLCGRMLADLQQAVRNQDSEELESSLIRRAGSKPENRGGQSPDAAGEAA